MDTLVVYSSKYGCTEVCARLLVEHLGGEIDCMNLKEENDVDLSKYRKVILGSPVYLGKILKEVDSFSETHLEELKEKTIGLFICGMQKEHVIEEELKANFPKELRERAVIKEWFGGAYDFDQMSFIDKMIIRKVAKADRDVSAIRKETILNFAETINKL